VWKYCLKRVEPGYAARLPEPAAAPRQAASSEMVAFAFGVEAIELPDAQRSPVEAVRALRGDVFRYTDGIESTCTCSRR
jgi:hypothetical protein